MLRQFRLGSVVLAVVLVLSMSVQCLGADLSAYGRPLEQHEMETTEGQWGPVVAGAVGGAFSGAFSYATQTEDPTWMGLGQATALGALAGATTGALGMVGKIATGASLAIDPVEVAWSAWAGATGGALKGAATRIWNNLFGR